MPIPAIRIIKPTEERNFGRFGDAVEVPSLTDVQTKSYDRFLQQLEEAIVGLGLHVGEAGDLDGVAEAAEVTFFRRLDDANCRDGHSSGSSQKKKHAGAIGMGRPALA